MPCCLESGLPLMWVNGVAWTLVNSNGTTNCFECRQLFASSQETVGDFWTEIGAMTAQRNHQNLLKYQHKVSLFQVIRHSSV
jgi:hypothetical protein